MSVVALDHDDNPTEPLPPKFESIHDILQIPNDRLQKQSFTNVIGIVTDFQPPCKTRGTDWKCAFTLRDISTQYDTGIKVHIFWPPEKMPHFDGYQDMVLIRNVKIQMFHGVISLRANHMTEFHQFRAVDQPSWPVKSKSEFPESKSSQKGSSPNVEEKRYVAWMFHTIDKGGLPSAEQFTITSRNAMNTRDKFSLLKDVQGDKFYDIIVEIVRMHQSSGYLTLYVTDYTPNSQFYNHAAVAANEYNSRDGDEYGYTKSKQKTDSTWPGPFGKMAIQLTLWEASADYISENGKQGDWIRVENVRMKYPKTGGCLEAAQHTERDNPERVRVSFMVQSEDPDATDIHWKEAVRRKRDYWKKFTEQKKAFEAETSGRGEKRLADEDASTSKKKKRRREKEERQQLAAKSHNPQAHKGSVPDDIQLQPHTNGDPPTPSTIQNLKDGLNMNVQSFHPDIAPLSFNELFNPTVYMRRTDQGNIGALPFINRNFKVAVKVVDYFPHHLVDFSQGRKVSDYDMLSDHSGDENSDTSSEKSHPFKLDSSPDKQKKWEWRFSLLLEDQTSHRSGNIRQWVVVDNHSAQMLLEMDATDLRKNKQEEKQLRERLAIFWGNLESLKWAIIRQVKNPSTDRSRESENGTLSYEQPLIRQMIGDSLDAKSDKVIEMLGKNAKPKPALFEEVAIHSHKPKLGDMPPTSDDEGDDVTPGQSSLPISSGDSPSATPDDPAAAYEAMLRDPKKRAIIHRLLRNESILKYYEPINISRIISKLLHASNKLDSAPFTCGIMEYGIIGKHSSEDHSDVNYKRRLKLFGTRILFPENP